MLDISKEYVLEKYMLDRGIINHEEGYSFKYCKGGVSCTVVFVYAGEKQMIIKQGLEKLKVAEEWWCDPNRMNIEQESNKIYNNIVPDCAPEVYFYDEKNYIYGREAIPESWRMWKEDLLKGILNYSSAKDVIETLVTVHNVTAKDKKTAKIFDDKTVFYNLRVSPYIEFVVKKHPKLETISKEMVHILMNSKFTLVHGDFSPKNIMADGEKISVLDYEVAHYGHPAFDISFFSTHFILKAVKNKQWANKYIDILRYMMDIYFEKVDFIYTELLKTQYLQLLGFIVLARVDGKSPVEYIDDESDKQLVRELAFYLLEETTYRTTYNEVFKEILNRINRKN